MANKKLVISLIVVLAGVFFTGLLARAAETTTLLKESVISPTEEMKTTDMVSKDTAKMLADLPEGSSINQVVIPPHGFDMDNNCKIVGGLRANSANDCLAWAPISLPTGTVIRAIGVIADFSSAAADRCTVHTTFWGEDLTSPDLDRLVFENETSVTRTYEFNLGSVDYIKSILLPGTTVRADATYQVGITLRPGGLVDSGFYGPVSRCKVTGVIVYYE